MGTVSSQPGQSKLDVKNDSIDSHNAKFNQSRILVSINSDSTVRISEGISIATQTPRDRNDLFVTETELRKHNTPNVKGIKENRKDKLIQTEDEIDVQEREKCANRDQRLISHFDENHENINKEANKNEQQIVKYDIMRRKELLENESEAGMTDYWTDTGVQTDDELTNYGVQIAWDSTSVDVSDRLHQQLSKAGIKEDNEINKRQRFDSPELLMKDKSFDKNRNLTLSPEDNRTGQSADLIIPASVKSDDSKREVNSTYEEKLTNMRLELNTQNTLVNEKENEDVQANRLPEHNLERLTIPFEQLTLERYGKYRVRMTSDTEKCIVSSATFLETGDVILIDRSNQKMKFVDKTFQFISSYDLPAKPWAICGKEKDIYVTMGNTKIQQLVVEDMIIEPVKSYEIKGRCLGICALNSHLAVGLQVGEICLLDSDGKKQGTIQLPSISDKPCNPWHLSATMEGNVLVTDSDACMLFCVNLKSEIIFTFKQQGSPRGTAVDSEGNILIVGRDKESGAVVSIVHKDEELRRMLHIDQQTEIKSRKLMTWEQLEFVPYCVCFRKDRVVVLGGLQESLKIMTLLQVQE